MGGKGRGKSAVQTHSYQTKVGFRAGPASPERNTRTLRLSAFCPLSLLSPKAVPACRFTGQSLRNLFKRGGAGRRPVEPPLRV